MDDARRLGSAKHLAGLFRIARERLLAHHVLAGVDRLEDDVGVCMGRRRHRHDLRLRQRESLRKRCECHWNAGARGAIRRLFRISSYQGAHLDARGAECADVRQHAEARTNDDGAERLFSHYPGPPV
jgi:hypothetical protein